VAEKLDPIVISLQLETARLQQQMSAVTGQVEKMGHNIEAQSGKVGKLSGSFKGLAGAMGKLLGAAAVVSFLNDSAKAAVEDNQSMALLARQLEVTTGASKEQVAQVEKQIGALEEMSGVADDKIRPAFAGLVRVTGDTTKAMELQKLAMDVSAGTGKDVGEVSKALAKAYSGQGTALARLVPGIKNSKDAMGDLAKQFKGAAKTAADANPYAKLSVMMDRLKETLGRALLPILTSFGKILLGLMPFINMVAKLFDKLVVAIMPIVEQLMTALMPAFDGLMTLILKIVDKVLPPLIKIINKILMPIILMLVDYLTNYLIPAWSALVDILEPVVNWIADNLVGAFQNLMKVLGPIWENVIKPIISGLASLLGIKIEPMISPKVDDAAVAKVDALNLTGFDAIDLSGKGGGGGAGGSGKKGQTEAEKRAAKEATAQQKFLNTMLDATKKYTQGIKAALKERNDALAQLDQEHADKIAQIQKDGASKLADIVKQSQDRLRSAFASVTNFDAGQMFINAGANISNFVEILKDKLTSGKKLAEDAAKLTAMGYSQTFVEQIISQGPMIAGELTKQLLQATPEQASEVQGLFKDLGTLQNTGVDTLAKQIYNTSGLATDELKTAYVTAQTELASALGAENNAYAKSAEDLQVKFEDAVAKLTTTRNTAIAKSLTALNDAMGTSAKTLTDAFKIINAGLATTVDNVDDKIHDIALGGLTGQRLIQANADLPYGSASYGTTPVAPVVAPGTAITTNVNVSTNASAQDISQAVVNNIKFNLPIVSV
jgi:phage-related protein